LERKDGFEGGCVVRHTWIPIVQHVWSRQWSVELFCPTTGTFALGVPFFGLPFFTQTIRSTGEEKHKQGPELF
jgi:hypothetical protein